jgi:hypothetical protein
MQHQRMRRGPRPAEDKARRRKITEARIFRQVLVGTLAAGAKAIGSETNFLSAGFRALFFFLFPSPTDDGQIDRCLADITTHPCSPTKKPMQPPRNQEAECVPEGTSLPARASRNLPIPTGRITCCSAALSATP